METPDEVGSLNPPRIRGVIPGLDAVPSPDRERLVNHLRIVGTKCKVLVVFMASSSMLMLASLAGGLATDLIVES